MNKGGSYHAHSPTGTLEGKSNPTLRKKILVPIDFSPESVGALRTAVSTAKRTNAHLTLLNVVVVGVVYRALEVLGWHRTLQRSHARSVELLAETEVPPTVTANIVVGSGDPADEIIRVAAEGHMDFILVGMHHPRSRRRWFGGRLARRVAKSAPCKVIVSNFGREVDVPA